MAIVRKTMKQAREEARADEVTLSKTTEADIRRHMIEDTQDPDAPIDDFELSARSVRQKLNMTQEEFASALRIPVAALRNWEENRVAPDPSALSLIKVVAKNPKAVFDALKEPS